MPISEKDHKELAELFSRTTKSGAQAATATRLFNEKASALGLDSFKLYNSFVQGGSLTVYQPPQPPAPSIFSKAYRESVAKTQTSTGGPGAGRWPDTVKIRISCAKVEQGSLATFKKQAGGLYTVQSITKESATANSNSGPDTASADFPASLLDWGATSCPHCGGRHAEQFGPVLCGQCGKLRCRGGVYRKAGRDHFRCVCGTDDALNTGEDEMLLDLATEARPNVTAGKSQGTPALTHSSPALRLPAPGRRG